jgi:hypothetical protein
MPLFRRRAAAVTLPDLAPGPLPVDRSALRSGASANGRAYVVTDYSAPAPVATATIQSIETLYGAGQAGRLGQVRWGERASEAFRGDLGALQRFAGGQGVPRVATRDTIRANSLEAGLPSTSTVPGQPANQMLSLLIATEQYTGAADRAGGGAT